MSPWTLVYSRQAQKDAKKLASSGRINIQRQLVYEVLPDRQIAHILRMWTHYE